MSWKMGAHVTNFLKETWNLYFHVNVIKKITTFFFLMCKPNKIHCRLKLVPRRQSSPTAVYSSSPGLSPAQKVPPAPDTPPSLWRDCYCSRASRFSICCLVSLRLEQMVFMACRALWTTGWSGCSPGVLLLYLKWITNKDLLYSTGNSAQCDVASWVGGQFRGE